MPQDVGNQASEAAKSFKNIQEGLGASEKAAFQLAETFEEAAKKVGEFEEKLVDSAGNLTNAGFDAMLKTMKAVDKAGIQHLKQQKEIYKTTQKFITGIEGAVKSITKFIPLVGDKIGDMFDKKIAPALTKRLQAVFTKMFAGKGGSGVSLWKTMGIGLIAAGAGAIAKQFSTIQNATIDISKQTGLAGKNLQIVSKAMLGAQNASYQFGITIKESSDAAAALVTSLGNFRKISPDLIKSTTLLAKYTGLSAEAAAEFTGTMTKAFGKNSKSIDAFANRMQEFATKSGVNARKVLGDIMQNTQLTSIYLQRGEDYLKRTAVQAAKLGKSMSEVDSTTKGFMDIESSAETLAELNQYTGGMLNSMEMFNLAVKKDTVGIMNKLTQAFSTPRGVRFIEEMPGYAEQMAAKFNLTLKDLRIMTKLEKEVTNELTASEKKQASIAEMVKSQQTSLDQITNKLKSAVLPVVNDIAGPIVNMLAGFSTQSITSATIGGVAAAIAGLIVYMKVSRVFEAKRKLADKAIPQAVYMVGGMAPGPGGPAKAFKNKWKGSGPAPGPKSSGGGGMTKVLSGMTKGGGGSMMATGLKGLKGLARGPWMSAIMMVPTLMSAIDTGKWSKMVPAVLGFAGGLLGMAGAGAIGALGGPLAIPAGIAGGMGGSMAGEWLGNKLIGAKKGAIVNRPTLFMAGEEGLPEMIVPTGRIARGMPINRGVAAGLGGMGVPGFAGGRMGAAHARASGAESQMAARAASQVQMGSMADPQTQRVRSIQYEQESQKRKQEQRDSMRMIEEKSLEILEEERSIAMDLGGPIGNFVQGLGLWDKAKKAAGEYAAKTSDRFFKHLKENNGDVMGALKATWGDTVTDLKGLQTKLYSKLEAWGNQLMNAAANWAMGKAEQGLGWIRKQASQVIGGVANRLNITGENKTQFTNAVKDLGDLGVERVASSERGQRAQTWGSNTMFGARASYGMAKSMASDSSIRQSAQLASGAMGGGMINTTSAYVGATIGKMRASSKALDATMSNMDPATALALARGDVGGAVRSAASVQVLSRGGGYADKMLAGTKLGGVGSSMVAGAGALAQGDVTGAFKGMGLDLGRKGIEKGATMGAAKLGAGKFAGAIGGGVAAGAMGAASGLMKGDMKAAGKGALSGAIGYGLGAGLGAIGVPPPLNMMIGSFLAGPVTEGVMKTGKELGKGAKNMAGGVGKMFSGDFKGGAGQLLKGGGQALMAGFKGAGALVKGLGKSLGFGKGVSGWGANEARAKVASQMTQAARAKKPMLTQGGVFTRDKWKQGMAIAVKLGENGPEENAMNEMLGDITRIFGVSVDIAQAFIYAALGANMDDETKSQIELEMTKGWGAMVEKGGWQADYDAGRLKQNWKSFRARSASVEGREAVSTAGGAVTDAAATRRAAQVAAAAAGGFTQAELGESGLMRDYKGGSGSGVGAQGNVYLDGVLVGVVAGSAAAGEAVDGLPTAVSQALPSGRLAAQAPAAANGEPDTSHL